MSDWKFLNEHRVTQPCATVPAGYCSTPEDGFNGLFRFRIDTHIIRCVVSDCEGWQHVSVSMERESKCPPWGVMCKIKELFWEDEEVVCQFHPKKSEYVNMHPYCLHLWRCTDGREFPTPPMNMVGIKGGKVTPL